MKLFITIRTQMTENLNLFIVCRHVLLELLKLPIIQSTYVDVQYTVIHLLMSRLENIFVSVIQMPLILQGHVKCVTLVVS